MWTRLTRTSPAYSRPSRRPTTAAAPRCNRARLQLENLEDREVPALTIQIDYSYDTGFFSDPVRRAVLEQAARDLGNQIDTPLGAIAPSGGNTWTTNFADPRTGGTANVSNPYIPANTIIVYAGGRDMPTNQAGVGGNGGYYASGAGDWINYPQSRGHSGFSLWGGSLSFSTNLPNFYFGLGQVPAGHVDFYSVATHELGHVLGIGTSAQWNSQLGAANGTRYFMGANAAAVNGGPVNAADGYHWGDGVTYLGAPTAMDPSMPAGTRVTFTALDLAALRDIGWTLAGGLAGNSAAGNGGAGSGINPPASGHNNGCNCGTCVGSAQAAKFGPTFTALSGERDGTVTLFTMGADGRLTPYGPRLTPFGGYFGSIRTVVSDFNGDGYLDIAMGTGSGTDAKVRIVDGRTWGDIVGPTSVLGGFGGGVFLAAGDVDRDGVAELAVSADAGGGTRVSVYKVQGGGLQLGLDFFAFSDGGDTGFRGGSRIAMGDVNRDGVADLIVGAGVGGGPAVSIYNGATLFSGNLSKLVPDFFALDPGLRSGVFVAAGDIDGDGFADVIFGTGQTGGPRLRATGGAWITANPGVDALVLPALADFFAFDENNRDGARVTLRDLDADGKAELVATTTSRVNNAVRVLRVGHIQSGPTPIGGEYTIPWGDPVTVDGVYVG